jgi:hypothetical protein
VTILHVYVFIRLNSLPLLNRWGHRKVLICSGALLWLIFFLGRVYGGNQYGIPTIALEVAGMHWMGSVFLMGVGLFTADLVSGFGFMFRRNVIRIRTLGVVFGLVLVFTAHVQGIRPPVIENREVFINGLPTDLDGSTVAVMADLHLGEIMVGSRWLNARIDQVQALQPDVIVLVGDLFERSSDPAELVPIMQRLSAPLGVYAVRGNYLVRTRYPFISDRYDINGMTLIVSRGTGTWGPRMRLWATGEIFLITLFAPAPDKQIDTTATEESPVSSRQEGKILRRPNFLETTNHQYCRPPQNDSLCLLRMTVFVP